MTEERPWSELLTEASQDDLPIDDWYRNHGSKLELRPDICERLDLRKEVVEATGNAEWDYRQRQEVTKLKRPAIKKLNLLNTKIDQIIDLSKEIKNEFMMCGEAEDSPDSPKSHMLRAFFYEHEIMLHTQRIAEHSLSLIEVKSAITRTIDLIKWKMDRKFGAILMLHLTQLWLDITGELPRRATPEEDGAFYQFAYSIVLTMHKLRDSEQLNFSIEHYVRELNHHFRDMDDFSLQTNTQDNLLMMSDLLTHLSDGVNVHDDA